MKKRLTGAGLLAACTIAASATPAFGDGIGTVSAQVTVAAPCVQVSPAQLDFGTLGFSSTAADVGRVTTHNRNELRCERVAPRTRDERHRDGRSHVADPGERRGRVLQSQSVHTADRHRSNQHPPVATGRDAPRARRRRSRRVSTRSS